MPDPFIKTSGHPGQDEVRTLEVVVPLRCLLSMNTRQHPREWSCTEKTHTKTLCSLWSYSPKICSPVFLPFPLPLQGPFFKYLRVQDVLFSLTHSHTNSHTHSLFLFLSWVCGLHLFNPCCAIPEELCSLTTMLQLLFSPFLPPFSLGIAHPRSMKQARQASHYRVFCTEFPEVGCLAAEVPGQSRARSLSELATSQQHLNSLLSHPSRKSSSFSSCLVSADCVVSLHPLPFTPFWPSASFSTQVNCSWVTRLGRGWREWTDSTQG